MSKHLDNLIDQIKVIEIDNKASKKWKLEDRDNPTTKVIEEQKIYSWIRVYLREEDVNIKIGDDISIKYTVSGEILKVKFICYGKEGNTRDYAEQLVNYNSKDDKKVLCFMVDTKVINLSKDIPFIRTMFKTGFHYEYQLVKRDQLIFLNDRTSTVLDYFDIDW